MFLKYLFVLSYLTYILNVYGLEHKTILRKDRNILLRKRRYLQFPEGSTVIFTFSFVKAVMVRKPKGYMSLLECDIPFKLPSATDRPIKHKFRYGRSVELKAKWIRMLNRLGINGESCVKRMICEAESIVGYRNKSIMSRIVGTLFREFLGSESCASEELQDCILPPFSEILRKILRLETFDYP
ncbi:uncharacterized protein LOC123682779 [Harmonia axyridis]|uniref:uncharacterized protein LOC123682779 n=1 Tax=Harmonia axyridis TaxID=115357 RepID=UPI001E279231|nr:uncharacterized protein LOC123682779 [Harmonia axyridis]